MKGPIPIFTPSKKGIIRCNKACPSRKMSSGKKKRSGGRKRRKKNSGERKRKRRSGGRKKSKNYSINYFLVKQRFLNNASLLAIY